MGELETVAVVAASRKRARPRLALGDGETAAWLIVVPLAALAVPLVALLATPVGTLLFPRLSPAEVLSWTQRAVRPEPREEGMYLLSLVLPVALAAGILLATGRRAAVPARLAVGLAWTARLALVLLLVASVAAQYGIRYEWQQGAPRYRFFGPATLIASALIAAAIAAALRSGAIRRQCAAALRDSRARRAGALAAAAAITAVWMLHAVNTDSSVAWMSPGVVSNLPYTSDETYAVVNGLTPLVDFTPQYATLWPYLGALALVSFGKTLLVFTITMSTLTAISLLAAYGILRRATGSGPSALLLYLPFLATSLFVMYGHPANSFTPGNYFADFPLRYAAPLLLAWLTARELERPRRGAPWPLFAAAGLVLLNSVNVGLPALGATLATVAVTSPLARRSWLELARGAVLGLLLAVGAVVLLTFAHAGTLPHFGQLSEFSRLYLGGLAATPLHGVLGLHLAVYLTYVAAIATATVRLRNRTPGRVLTGMLLWNGVYGLGALSYFVVESGPIWLEAGFSTWALTLMLLAVVVVRRLASRGARWPEPAELAVLFGVGVMACSLAQFSAPWSQIERLTADYRGTRPVAAEVEPFLPDPSARAFIASLADGHAFYLKRGAPVALLFEEGHRVADAYGVVNVSPYPNANLIFTQAALRKVVERLRRAGGNTIVTSAIKEPAVDLNPALLALGFSPVREVRGGAPMIRYVRGEGLVKWVDRRTVHPRALRNGRGQRVTGMRW